jgi:hypothetical protein
MGDFIIMATKEKYSGSDCTGSSGDTSRTLTLSNTSITLDNDFLVFVNNSFQHLTSDFTVVPNSIKESYNRATSVVDNCKI